MRSFAVLVLSLTACLHALAVQAQDLPTDQVHIENIQYRGTGCREGSVALNLAPDAQAMTMMFSDYVVETRERDGRPARKNCNLDLTMSVPSGWSYALLGFQVRGYASLERGVIAVQGSALAPIAGVSNRRQDMGKLRIEGVFDNDYQNFSETPVSLLNWSQCGAARTRVTFNTFIAVRPKQGFQDDQGDVDNTSLGRGLPRGLITIDTIDHTVNQLYTFMWKKCDDDGESQTPADVTATCMISAGQRQFRESATSDTLARAKRESTLKVVNTCQLAMGSRPQVGRVCAADRAICSFVRDRHGPGNTHGHTQISRRPTGQGGGGRPGRP